jgi:hypothetical protein
MRLFGVDAASPIYGRHYASSPVMLKAPYSGRWRQVVKPSGGRVEAAVQVLAA